jgi:hypothetical protein
MNIVFCETFGPEKSATLKYGGECCYAHVADRSLIVSLHGSKRFTLKA